MRIEVSENLPDFPNSAIVMLDKIVKDHTLPVALITQST